jgi:carbamate kinase
MPIRIVEIEAIRTLMDAGVIVIAVGGGGIPVVADENGDLTGLAAVIDKDLASALLANEINADLLLISTAIEKVALRFGTPEQEWVDRMTLAEVKQHLAEGIHFKEGSMAPKMRAVVQFLEGGGRRALITNPENIAKAMAGDTGTWIVP